jgi:hypothetical protein
MWFMFCINSVHVLYQFTTDPEHLARYSLTMVRMITGKDPSHLRAITTTAHVGLGYALQKAGWWLLYQLAVRAPQL